MLQDFVGADESKLELVAKALYTNRGPKQKFFARTKHNTMRSVVKLLAVLLPCFSVNACKLAGTPELGHILQWRMEINGQVARKKGRQDGKRVNNHRQGKMDALYCGAVCKTHEG